MPMKTNESSKTHAFTRLELMMVLATLLLLATVAWPLLAGNKLRSEQVACLSNLRQIGHAVHLWGNDHGDRTPWFTPESEGGTRGTTNPLKENAWFQIAALSNELVTPKILVCPGDQGLGPARKMAESFSFDPVNGGFFTPGYRSASLSYLVGLHAYSTMPRSILSGDRNIRWDNVNNGCALGFNTTLLVVVPPADVFWTNAVHGVIGNVLFMDGTAEEVSIRGLQRAMADPYEGDNGNHHFLAPN
jgi:type II secretory pathway pseudopilin PulG